MYYISALFRFKINWKKIAIETSGCYPLKGIVDWYTFSPKKFKSPTEEAYKKADELKIVIYNKSELGSRAFKKVGDHCLLYIQPEWSKWNR